MAFDSVKKAVAEFALDKVLRYVGRDPERAIVSLLDFSARIATHPKHKAAIRSLRERLHVQPGICEQARRLARNPKVLSKFMVNWVANNYLIGRGVRERLTKELGARVPSLILIDPTAACNLKCIGCWAGEYSKGASLEPELFDRILREAEELGIYWIVLSGGEPFAYRPLFDVIAGHPDMVFMAYTNGTLIDERTADRLAEVANLSPAFSLEGWREQTDARRGEGTYDKVIRAMGLLRERGVLFGASVTATRHNVDELFGDRFIDYLIDQGVVYMWSFHYVPVGRDPDPSLMITSEQRSWLTRRVPELRANRPILIADFWNDGEFTGGCIAGGRAYFHITAAGDVEPCAFAHFATDNIRGRSLVEVLQNPVFWAYEKRQPFNDNHLAPCPIIDNPQALRDIVRESGAYPTHEGAGDILRGEVAGYLDRASARWRREAAIIKAEKDKGTRQETAG